MHDLRRGRQRERLETSLETAISLVKRGNCAARVARNLAQIRAVLCTTTT